MPTIFRNVCRGNSTALFLGILSSSSVFATSTRRFSATSLTYWHNTEVLGEKIASTMCPKLKSKMVDWSFAGSRLRSLPTDPETENFVRQNVPGVVFSRTHPTPFESRPVLVATSDTALRDILDMDGGEMAKDDDFVDFVAGNKVIDNSHPLAHRYGGHQFGYWAGQLGDGRAILLGEYENNNGQRWELQLKGSGKTPYSRFGDGRAVLRSSIREFLCSEAMHFLGIPTSRAASLAVVDDTVMRDVLYNGNAKMERCAVVLRLAPTWFRIGSIEILARNGEEKALTSLIDFVLANHFDHVKPESGNKDDWILAFFDDVVGQTALLVAHWMAVGFTHGVLNTDNLSLASITIDYGPFGFVEDYDPNFTPNHSDDSSRYDYESQPKIALWNLAKLATALTAVLPVPKHGQLQQILNGFNESYDQHRVEMFSRKLGFISSPGTRAKDKDVIGALMEAFEESMADFTQTFRDLADTSLADIASKDGEKFGWGLGKMSTRAKKKFDKFADVYAERLDGVGESERFKVMDRVNPRYVLRNWMAQKAIEKAENDDFSGVKLLLDVLSNPYAKNEAAEKSGFSGPAPRWAENLVVSCSS